MSIQPYLQLVTSEHAGKPNFIALLSAALQAPDDIETCAGTMNTQAFDLDNAVGAQLDVLGEIVGVSRTLDFQPSDGSSPVLDDNTYRLILRAKIAKNQWDGTIPAIYSLWQGLFPTNPQLGIQDNQDMTITARISLFTPLQKDLVSNGYLLPRPEGVKLIVALEYAPVDSAAAVDNGIHVLTVTPGTGSIWGDGDKWGQGYWMPPAVYGPPKAFESASEGPRGRDNITPAILTPPLLWGVGKWGQN